MKTRNIFGLLAASALLLWTGCTKEDGMDVPENVEGVATVNFHVGGAAGLVGTGNVKTRAAEPRGGELQSEAEKTVCRLLAVAFDDPNGAAKSSDVDGDEKFYRCIEVEIPAGATESEQTGLSFGLEKEGPFQICFIGNPNDALKEKINGLAQGTATVDNLKQILVETQAPDEKTDKGMLMTSQFYAVTSSFTKPSEIPTVTLTRAMARLDIINACDGVNITKVIFHNRAIKSRLYNDNTVSLEDGLIEDAKEYADCSLVGSSQEPTSYTEKIYTYEQLATEKEQHDKRPYLEVHYQMPSVEGGATTYKHDVYFNDAAAKPDDGDDDTALQLQRNHLYRVKITNDNANISFALTVVDWIKGEEIAVGNDDIIDGLQGEKVEGGASAPDAWGNGGTEEVVAN